MHNTLFDSAIFIHMGMGFPAGHGHNLRDTLKGKSCHKQQIDRLYGFRFHRIDADLIDTDPIITEQRRFGKLRIGVALGIGSVHRFGFLLFPVLLSAGFVLLQAGSVLSRILHPILH